MEISLHEKMVLTKVYFYITND